MKGLVFDIQRLSVHDGPGIRTTVFLKGCPLHCLWCHNPESQRTCTELALYTSLCIGCEECVTACQRKCHSFKQSIHLIDRENCTCCGECTRICTGALTLIGHQMTVEEVVREIGKDSAFYRNSGGGMTISGGEPFMQPAFTCELLARSKEEGFHTCVETSGYAPWKAIDSSLAYIDLLLFDYKETNPAHHRDYTGVDNQLILENLRRLNERRQRIVLRCPIIPGYNDRPDHFQGIARAANCFAQIQEINIEPYNRFGESKSEAIGIVYPIGIIPVPDDNMVQDWIDQIQSQTDVPVVKS